jgi:hypothetical protein
MLAASLFQVWVEPEDHFADEFDDYDVDQRGYRPPPAAR